MQDGGRTATSTDGKTRFKAQVLHSIIPTKNPLLSIFF